MIPTTWVKRVCLVHTKIDFRKRHEGLLAEAYKLGINPYEGDLIVFVGRRKNAIKLLFADKNGLWEAYKRFHYGVVSKEFKFLQDPTATQIPPSMVAKLIEGSRFNP